MLKPNLIRAWKDKGLPFFGNRAHLKSALVKEATAEKRRKKAVPLPGEKCNAEKEMKEMKARGCPANANELPNRDQNKSLASRDLDDGRGSVQEKVKLLQKDQKRMGDKVDLQMMKRKRKK